LAIEPHPKAVPRKLEISGFFKRFFTYSSGVIHQSLEHVDRSQFGKVIGYIYRKTYDKNFLFSPNGNLLEIYTPKVRKPEVYLKVGYKEINEGLQKQALKL
jgi:hypothetical protein